jgi:hypothetical protein
MSGLTHSILRTESSQLGGYMGFFNIYQASRWVKFDLSDTSINKKPHIYL